MGILVNGESRNWIRFQITLSAFRTIFGHWPTKIKLYSFFIDELKEKLSTSDFSKLCGKIEILEDDKNPFLATDDQGNSFDYARARNIPEVSEDIDPWEWLGISEPDYYD